MPDQPAVTTGGRTWTYAQLWAGASYAAHSLQRQGVSPGDNVMLALPNGAEFFLAFFGTLMAGGVAVPVFPRSTAERLALPRCPVRHTRPDRLGLDAPRRTRHLSPRTRNALAVPS